MCAARTAREGDHELAVTDSPHRDPRPGRSSALALVVALWAAIYLPALGSTEIKGEEGRRILPAVAMLESGDWIVPSIAGEPYLRKPPLINWLVALSFLAAGTRNEWTARLPSVLSVLALALTMVWVGGRWLGTEPAFLAALFALTNISMIEKGRLIEIEALYIALSGAAIVCWLGWWARGRSPWLTWVVPFALLGLAVLAKGPLHLLFFYAIAAAVLWRAGEARRLLGGPHLAGVLVMLLTVGLWAVPLFRAVSGAEALDLWSWQFAGRVTGGPGGRPFDLGDWLLNILRGLANYLPWLALTPLLWRRGIVERFEGRQRALFAGARIATVGCFLALLVLPGIRPRYTLPLLVPASLLLAMALREPLPAWVPRAWQRGNVLLAAVAGLGALGAPVAAGLGWPSAAAGTGLAAAAGLLIALRRAQRTPTHLAVCTGIILAIGMGLYALVGVPLINRGDDVRPVGRQIDGVVPPERTLYTVDLDDHAALFYVRARVLQVGDTAALPRDAEYVLVRAGALARLAERGAVAGVLADVSDKRRERFLVLRLRPGGAERRD